MVTISENVITAATGQQTLELQHSYILEYETWLYFNTSVVLPNLCCIILHKVVHMLAQAVL